MASKKNPESSPLALVALVVVAALLVCYFSASFFETPPYVEFSVLGNPNFTVLYHFLAKVFYLAGASAILFACLCAGEFLLSVMKVEALPAVEEGVLAIALGIGTLSLATLGLGASGILTSHTAVALLTVMCVLGFAKVGKFFTRAFARTAGNPWSRSERLLAATIVIAALITIVYSFSPPMDFDVLEYHLAAPAHYFQTGSVRYISHNVYSNFPQNAEMLHLFSMVLTGAKSSGAMLGKVLSALAALLAAGAAFSLGKWLFSRGAGIFAAAALLSAGGFFHVATAGYVEPFQVLYTLCAVLAVGRFLQTGSRGALLAGAVSAGLAMGVKYPAALFVAAPLALAVLISKAKPARRLLNFALFCGISALVVAPWLLKNVILTGNPVYPLLYSVFGGRDWSGLQDARWITAHTPKGGLAWEQWARHVVANLFSNEAVTFLAFAFVPLVFFARRASKRVVYALFFAVLYLVLWFAVTHRIGRFLLGGLAVSGAVSGAGLFALQEGWTKKLLSGLAVGIALLNVFYMAGVYGNTRGLDPSVALFGNDAPFLRKNKEGYEAWERLNNTVPRGSKVLLVAEAETFYIDVDFSGTTVFDVKPLETMAEASGGDPLAVARAMREAGFDYVFVNWFTFKRQQETYGFDYEGASVPGYSATIGPGLFEAMERAGGIVRVYSASNSVYPGTPASVLYRVE